MKIACYRHQTDRFDNFYDGVTPVNQELQPLFKPTQFLRGYEISNPSELKCKINTNETGVCWNYYFHEYQHDIVYGTQQSCKVNQTPELAKVFKNKLQNPKTKVLGWENLNNKKEFKNIRQVIFPLYDYMNSNLIKIVDPSEIENSSKEFFIDFRGENSQLGKMIIKPKNFALYDPEIK